MKKGIISFATACTNLEVRQRKINTSRYHSRGTFNKQTTKQIIRPVKIKTKSRMLVAKCWEMRTIGRGE